MVVSLPNVWPPSVTPEVELRLGAVSVSSDPVPEAPGSWSCTSCSALGSLLINVTRSVPSVPCVAQTLTGPARRADVEQPGAGRERLGEHQQPVVLGVDERLPGPAGVCETVNSS